MLPKLLVTIVTSMLHDRNTELNNSTIILTVILSMPQWSDKLLLLFWRLYKRRTSVDFI